MLGLYFVLYVLVCSTAAGLISAPWAPLTELQFWFGPEIERILQGQPLENANRMPLASYFLAALSTLWNEQLPALILKNLLVQTMLAFVLYQWWRRPAIHPHAMVLILYVLLFPQIVRHGFALVPEEGYLIAMLAFLFHGLLIAPQKRSLLAFLPYAVVCAAIYLTKESMLVLSPAICLLYFIRTKRFDVLTLFLTFVLSSMLWWGFTTLDSTDHFSLTTNNAGREIWKGNNPRTLEFLPHTTLDRLSGAAPRRKPGESQWEWSHRCRDEALSFIVSEPAAAGRILLLKLYQTFISVTAEESPSWSSSSFGYLRPGLKSIGVVFMLIFRFLFFAALIYAAGVILRCPENENKRSAAVCYLAFVAAFCLPFLVAWGTERRLIPIVIPTVLYVLFVLECDGRVRALLGMPRSVPLDHRDPAANAT